MATPTHMATNLWGYVGVHMENVIWTWLTQWHTERLLADHSNYPRSMGRVLHLAKQQRQLTAFLDTNDRWVYRNHGAMVEEERSARAHD
jgi:hypothetical protein